MKFIALSALCALSQVVFSQSVVPLRTVKEKPGEFYFAWGYQRNSYSRSSIQFKDNLSDSYNFKLYRARAKDQPDMKGLFKQPPTVPQYVLRIGYFFNTSTGIEFSWDHLKYVMRDNQVMRLKGNIRGKYFDTDTLITSNTVHFEHTNGNNYAMVSVVKRHVFFESPKKLFRVSALFTLGGGILVPKTDSSIFGNHNDGPFRCSGIVMAASSGVRYDFLRFLFVEASFKGAFADYTNAKMYMAGRARHTFFSAQYVLDAGINVPLQWK